MKKQFIRRLFVFTSMSSLLLLNSCMYGGGTLGTGVLGYGDGSGDSNFTTYKLKASVVDTANKAISGIKITVSSNSMKESSSTTDAKGNFTINVKSASGDPLRFNFTKGAINASCESYISPAGEESVSIKLKIINAKKAVCP